MYIILAVKLFMYLIQDAVSIVESISDAMNAAKTLTETAFKKGSADNISALVVRFHHHSQEFKDLLVERFA